MLQAMVISADGKYLAASTMVGVGVMDLTTGKGRTLDIYGQKQIHSGGAGAQYGSTQGISQHLAFTADGKSLVCGRGDGSFRVYDPQTGKVLRTLARRGKPGFAPQAIAGDGSRVAWFDYATATVRIADVATGKDVRTLKLPQGSTIMADGPNGMDLSHDGQAIACSIMTKEGPGQILVADVKTGKFVATLTEKTDKRAEKPTRKPKKGVVQNGGAAGTPAGNSPATGPSTSGNTGPAAPVPSGFGGGLSGGGGFGGGGFGGGFIAGGAGKFGGGRSGGGVAVGGGRGGGGFGRGVQAGAVNEGPAEFPTGMETVVFSPDGKSIATSGFGGQIILWENPLNPAAAVSPGESAK
jgi:WD40 repeat protein